MHSKRVGVGSTSRLARLQCGRLPLARRRRRRIIALPGGYVCYLLGVSGELRAQLSDLLLKRRESELVSSESARKRAFSLSKASALPDDLDSKSERPDKAKLVELGFVVH